MKILFNHDNSVVKCQNSCAQTPIRLAVKFGNLKIIKCLLEFNVINLKTVKKSFFSAVRFGHVDVAGCFVNMSYSSQQDERTWLTRSVITQEILDKSLYLAVWKGYKDMAGYLMDRGASVNYCRNSGQESVFSAASRADRENEGMGMVNFLNRKKPRVIIDLVD